MGLQPIQRKKEVYTCFVKYLRLVANGRRRPLRLSSILIFVTEAAEEPALGFTMDRSITLYFFRRTTQLGDATTTTNLEIVFD